MLSRFTVPPRHSDWNESSRGLLRRAWPEPPQARLLTLRRVHESRLIVPTTVRVFEKTWRYDVERAGAWIENGDGPEPRRRRDDRYGDASVRMNRVGRQQSKWRQPHLAVQQDLFFDA